MRDNFLLQIAFDASRFLEGALDDALIEDIEAIDPGVDNNEPYIVIQTKAGDALLRVSDSLPAYFETAGRRVEIICKTSEPAYRMN